MAPLYQYLGHFVDNTFVVADCTASKGSQGHFIRGHGQSFNLPQKLPAIYGIWTTNRKDHHHAVTAIAVNFSGGHVIGNVVGDIELCRGGLHGDWWPGERCWGNDEDIADRHTTSRGGGVTVPVQNNKGGAELVLSGGYSWRGWITYACHLCNKV